MTGFDTVIMMDWSAGNDRGASPKADAIWVARARAGRSERPVYLRNRQLAETWLNEAIEQELAAGRRALVGFDFPFGYPAGFAKAVTGQSDPFAVWDWISAHVEDAPDQNNRFDVAGQLNALFDGVGPFWGNGLKRDVPNLPRLGSARTGHRMPERRAAETAAPGAFTLWQLSGAGAVGGQALTGIPVLNRLRARWANELSIWPFEPLNAPVGIVEIWPSLIVGQAPDGWIKDAWQVHEVARIVSALGDDQLATILDVAPQEEGWIFGLGFEDQLRNTGPKPPPLSNDCFALPPGVSWTPVDVALEMLRQRLSGVVEAESVDVSDALGRVLAKDIVAPRAHPPRPNAAVDGYGFAGGRDAGDHVLPLVEARAAAGANPDAVPAGHAIRILTGAQLPAGVDTIVLQEDVTLAPDAVAFRGPIKPGANTRAAAEDVSAGDIILSAGRRITAGDIALAVSTGVARMDVNRRLRVGVLSTGDELADVREDVGEDRIFDANRPMLLSLIHQLGHKAVDLGRAPDKRAAVRASLNAAARSCDAILTSGGASAGEEDHISAVLQESGALSLWRIAIKPGRPLALGMWSGTPVFGLPGNPVAAYVCALVFARPALNVLAGGTWQAPQGFDVPANFAKSKRAGRREFLRARVREGRVELFGSEGSGRVSGLSWAEGLVELGDAEQAIEPGDLVRFIPWAGFGL